MTLEEYDKIMGLIWYVKDCMPRIGNGEYTEGYEACRRDMMQEVGAKLQSWLIDDL